MSNKFQAPMNGGPMAPNQGNQLSPQIPECFCTTYAAAFVLFQQPGDIYEPMDGLRRGTIYPELDIPYTHWRFKNG